MRSVFSPALRVVACILVVLAVIASCRYAVQANPTTAALTFLIAIVAVAAWWGLRYAVFLSIVATLAFNYFFLPPVGSFSIVDPQDGIALVTFLVTALVVSHLSRHARNVTVNANQRDTAALGRSERVFPAAEQWQLWTVFRRASDLQRSTIRRGLLASALVLALLAWVLGSLHSTNATAFTHTTVIDVGSGVAHPNYTIVIRGQRIGTVGPDRSVHIPGDATVIDLSNKFVIPGLWDMHVHIRTDEEIVLPLYIANGITGVRDMGGDLTVLQHLRARIRKGAVLGPRIFCSGPVLDGPGLNLASIIIINDAEDATDAIKELRDGGADFIKIYSFLSRDAYFAIAREAKRRRMTFVGHVPLTVSVAEASAAGQHSVEHLSGILMGCSNRENDLRRTLWQATEQMTRGGRPYSRHPYIALTGAMLSSFSAAKCQRLFEQFKKNDTWQVPTLVVLQGLAFADDPAFRQSRQHLEYLDTLGKHWQTSVRSGYFRGISRADFSAEKERFQKDLELVDAMHKAGVRLLAGSDSPNPFDVPGFALHDELELLVRAGLTPAEALRAATSDATAFLRLHDDGAIAPGRLADLVVLRANPLADIRNTRDIETVIMRGKVLTRSDLDGLLERALTARRRRLGIVGW